LKKFFSNPKILLVSVFLSLSLLAVGFLAGSSYGYLINPPINISVLGRGNTQEVDFSEFWRVWDTLTGKYLFSSDLVAQDMVWGAISGMVQSASDPYTSFLTPENNQAIKESLNGSYEGIGAELGMEEDQLIVVSPLDGSPAKAAGLQPQDKIIKIDGEPTVGITIIEAVAKIRGTANTKVMLTILHEDDKDTQDIEIIRGTINIPSIVTKTCDQTRCSEEGLPDERAVYIRISRFGDDTNELWDKLVASGQLDGFGSIIVDVRGNPGGYLLSPVHIAGDFLDEGSTVLWQENARGFKQPLRTDREPRLKDVTVIVLIDKGSASASEILAAALREKMRAVIVGETSFGKGTIQEAQDFSDGSGLHVTTAKWLTPSKEWIHDKGLVPDIEVDFDDGAYKAGTDTQLQKALELIQ